MTRAMTFYDQYHVFMHKRSGSLQKKRTMPSQIEDQRAIMQVQPLAFPLLAIKLWDYISVVLTCHTYDLTHKIPMATDVILQSKN